MKRLLFSITNVLKANKTKKVVPTSNHPVEQKITIVFHAYHLDLAKQIFVWIKEFAVEAQLPVNLIVTTPANNTDEINKLSKGSTYESEVITVENHGRDVWPFLQVCQSGKLSNSALVLKIHTKAPRRIAMKVSLSVESVHELLNPALIPGLLQQTMRNKFFVSTLKRYVGRTSSWGLNIKKYFQLIKKLQINSAPRKLRFPAGTIFWTTGEYASYIGTLNIDRSDFAGEPSPDDGATEHVLERLFGMLAKDNGGVIPLEKLVTRGQIENRNLRN